ncbi:Protein SERAC1 [Apiospora arundinis]|uniref:Protein SERAC1 n=1 Tax=Apiospora arundinis TaxID=335852 RepID=A0ABR2IFM6_9PEZI
MHRFLSQTCRGLLFFGVPQLGLRNEKLASVVEGQPNQALIRALVVDDESEPSDFLGRMSDDFARCFQGRLRVISFYERRLSSTVEMQPDGTLQKLGPPVLMVTRKSATSTGLTAVADEDIIPFDADHSGLVKFESRREDAYIVVKERIKSLVSGVVPCMEDPVVAPASKQKGPVVATQHGSTFGGQYTINGGIFSQGNVMNL